jgi:hypothetical protein
MSKRTRADLAAEAANKASEAARTLQARGQETRQESSDVDPKTDGTDPKRMEQLLANRPSVQARDEILAKRGVVDEPEEKAEEKPAEKPAEAKAAPEIEKPAETAPPVEAAARGPQDRPGEGGW